MRTLTRSAALGTLLLGLALAGWGPALFAAVTGAALPLPRPSDPIAMSIWSGLALLRVFGGALVVLGAVIWTLAAPAGERRRAYLALGLSATFGLLLALVQALAIWSGPLSLMIAAPFAAIALVGWLGGRTADVPASA